MTRLRRENDDRLELFGSPLRSYSTVGLFGRVVTVKTDGPSMRVEAAYSVGEFLVTDDAAGSLFHTKHPTWLKVRTVRLYKTYTRSPSIARTERAGSFPKPGQTRVKLARDFSTYEVNFRCPLLPERSSPGHGIVPSGQFPATS